MNELKFTCQDYVKYNSMRIHIDNATLKLKKKILELLTISKKQIMVIKKLLWSWDLIYVK